MPSASLAVVHRAHLNPVRVAALSVAMILNLTALLLVLRPLAPQIAKVIESVRAIPIEFIPPPAQPPPPPDIQVKPFTKPVPITTRVHVPVVQKELMTPPTSAPTAEPSHNSEPPSPPAVPPSTMAPGVVSLAYLAAPLRFPPQALRQHLQGTVILRVLVDENGRPIEAQIDKSSGHALLDESAREQVLAHWRFQPAEIGGHTMKAWARVPVRFMVQDL